MPLLPLAAILPTGRVLHRHLQPEWMDDPALDAEQHHAALAALARLNRLSGTANALWPTIANAARRQPDRPVRVVDVACGGGDITLDLWRRARAANLSIEFAGCDISPVALDHARQQADRERARIDFFEHDPVHEPLPEFYDLAISSLFLHHLPGDEAVTVLNHLGERCRQVAIDDLARTTWGWLLAWGGSRAVTRNPVVHVDATRSVEGAFTPAELAQLAEHAGLKKPRIRRRWPARMQLLWSAQ
jgi:SAM-dependent methyltransferase